MANTLTGLVNTIYESLDTVSRELVGAIPACKKDVDTTQCALNQTIRTSVAPAKTLTAITAANVSPDSGSDVFGYKDVTLDKAWMVPIAWTGEEQMSVGSARYQAYMGDQFKQAFRAIANQMETDLLTAAYKGASRAYGTAATTPFASSLSDLAQIKKILDDNGAPDDGLRSLIVDTTAGANLRQLTHLTSVNSAGSDELLRVGMIGGLFGFNVRESAKVQAHTKGTGTGYVCEATGYAAGSTTYLVDGGNSGTILAGDVVTLSATDTNKYVIYSGGTATGNAAGTLYLNKPGLLIAKVNDDAMTIGGSYRANVAFHRDALVLANRLPAMTEEKDGRLDTMIVTDPISGISFEVSAWSQYRQIHYEVAAVWGVAALKSEHIAILLG